MSKESFSQDLLANNSNPQSASAKIPIIARHAVSDRAKKTLDLVSESLITCSKVVGHPVLTVDDRLRDSSSKNVFQPIRSSTPSSAKARRDGVPTRL